MKRTWWKIQLPKVKCNNVESKFPLKALLSLFTNHSSAGVKCNLQIPRGKHSRFEVNQSLQIPIWSATSLNLNKISETFGGKLSFDFYHIIDVLLFTVTMYNRNTPLVRQLLRQWMQFKWIQVLFLCLFTFLCIK